MSYIAYKVSLFSIHNVSFARTAHLSRVLSLDSVVRALHVDYHVTCKINLVFRFSARQKVMVEAKSSALNFLASSVNIANFLLCETVNVIVTSISVSATTSCSCSVEGGNIFWSL